MTKSYQQQYAEILKRLINEPEKQTPSRVGDVRSRFVETIRVDVQKEFPLMEIKNVSFKNILVELLWFIKGNTNIKYLVENGCNIWNDDAYRYYKQKYSPYRYSGKENPQTGQLPLPFDTEITKEEFLEKVLSGERLIDKFLMLDENNEAYLDEKYAWLDTNYVYGDLDKIYGRQWRNFNGYTDQLQNCIDTLKTNPDDRRMIVTAHNPTDLEIGDVGLPSCHNYFQFYSSPLTVEERIALTGKADWKFDTEEEAHEIADLKGIPKRKLSLYYNIRSNDFFLGQPYNTPSYALLLHMVAEVTNMLPYEVVCNAVDCHLYEAHLDAAKEWLERYKEKFMGNGSSENEREAYFTFCKSKLNVKNQDKIENIDDFDVDNFELSNYNPDSRIKAPLLT